MPYKDKEIQKAKNREYQKKHYLSKTQYYKDKAAERRKALKKQFDELKLDLRCESCGESHIACLDFHHLNPEEKDMNVSRAVADGWGLERIKKEIEKCKVLCANCHRKLHYEEYIAG